MPHYCNRRRRPLAAAGLGLFLLLMLVAWIGTGLTLVIFGVVIFGVLMVRAERSAQRR